MKFLDGHTASHDLTYSDVFLVPSLSSVKSRFDIDITTPDGIGTTIPIVVANMNAVAGKRMAETVARRGGIVVLPQDIPEARLKKIITSVKKAHPVFETPISLTAQNTIYDALSLINKRSHGIVVVIDKSNKPIGIFTEKDAIGKDSFTEIGSIMSKGIVSLSDRLSPEEMYAALEKGRLHAAPVVDKKGVMVGVITLKGALRSQIYKPALDQNGKLMVAAAIGINGDVEAKTSSLLAMGVNILVVDTAHGHQLKALQAIERARKITGNNVTIVAGNVVTKQAVFDLIDAGADIIKVGVGPGAMCTTRMMTGVGRPQFSAVLECAEAARSKGKHIWADGGVKYPRDVALALAAGASSVMFASWLAGTYESASDMQRDEQGRLYKENYGMASNRAVKGRTSSEASFERAKKELFEEGINSSRLYVDPKRPGVEDIIDQIMAGLRSSCTYAGATSINDFYNKAIVGIQTSTGYQEGAPVLTSWA